SIVIDYLSLLDFINYKHISRLSIYSSSSYIISAAKINLYIKAIITLSIYNIGSAFYNSINNLKSTK
ncbi:hypothetical protein C7974DRAFT_305621, partial [Boeremia exigua]|uniref:uncharacterized protein n=1 Tax=Boeremia exigua TaxID=749465 RepID=UPI001E8D8D2E